MPRILGIELDRRARKARLHGRPLYLSPDGINVLECFVVSPGTTFVREDLVAVVSERALDAVIAELVDAIGADRLITDGGYQLALGRFGLVARDALVLDPEARFVRLGDDEEQLSPTETHLAKELLRPLTTEELTRAVGADRPPRMPLLYLRDKLRRLAGGRNLLQRVPTVAYPQVSWQLDGARLWQEGDGDEASRELAPTDPGPSAGTTPGPV